MKDDKSKPVSEPAKVDVVAKPLVEEKPSAEAVKPLLEEPIPALHEEPLKSAPETMKASRTPKEAAVVPGSLVLATSNVSDAVQALLGKPAAAVPAFVEPANPFEGVLASYEALYPRGGTFHRRGEAGTSTMLTVAGKPFVQGAKILLPVIPPNTRKIRYVEIGDV